MAKNELTGVERQLVLDYLVDGNAPLTISLEKEDSSGSLGQEPVQPVFPLALKAEQIQVLEQGIILLKNAPESASLFLGRMVRVQFYFNKLALYFITKVQAVPAKKSKPEEPVTLALVIPASIFKVEDKKNQEKSGFSVTVYYEASSKKNEKHQTDIVCDFDERFPLFVHSDYKEIAKLYLSEKEISEAESIEGRIHSPKVVYIDSARILFGARKTDMPFAADYEYAVLLRFPISGPVKERKVYFTCVVDEVFENYDCNRLCACAKISSIREEDVRFLSDKMSHEGK